MNRMRTRIAAFIVSVLFLILSGCASGTGSASVPEGPVWSTLQPAGTVPLSYATQFSITDYDGGYRLIEIETGGRFLLVGEDQPVPRELDGDITVLKTPLDRIYLAATSAMDFFRALDRICCIRLSGSNAKDWYIEEARLAMEKGDLLFAGKYSAPDYELIFSEQCDLAIESTMIYHTPKIKEQLEKLGVPVLVERSSYEEDPLGRMEWIKVYGALLGESEKASELFDLEVREVEPLLDQQKTGKKVAFFYITTTGTVNVRKTGDYVARMIALAGGEYVFSDLDSGSALSTVNMTMESFYDGAKDADILIYNSTIDSELYSMDDLIRKSGLLADFKAVKNGDVWCTGKNLFQEPTGFGKLIAEMHRVFTDDIPASGEMDYLHKLT